MKYVSVALGASLLALAPVANSDVIYDYSLVGYLDAERTMEAVTVTAKISDDTFHDYTGVGGNFIGFQIVELEILLAGETEPASYLPGSAVYSQFTRPVDGDINNPWDDHGITFRARKSSSQSLLWATSLQEPFSDFNDLFDAREYLHSLGTGKLRIDGTMTTIFTQSSLTAAVPGPGFAMSLLLGGVAIGRGRRR